MIGRKEERTLDSNPFNDVYSIFMLSVILIMRIEWKELKTDENVIGCDLESIRFLSFITENELAMQKYGLEVGIDCS